MEQHDHQRGTVRKRRVFYIPGYDPFHPRRYRELYRKEARAQAMISGYEIKLLPKAKGDSFGWRVATVMDGQAVESEISVLYWADIVQGSMDVGIIATYWQMLRTAWAYMASAVVWRLARLRKGPLIAALYPVVMLTLQLSLAVGLGLVTGYVAERALLSIWPMAGGRRSGWAWLSWAWCLGRCCVGSGRKIQSFSPIT